jgi:hypothetical protein
MHQCCACHIINLIVKSSTKRLKPYIEDSRTAISFLNSSNQRIAAFKSLCACNGVHPRKFDLDMDVRWNSTYLMLKHVVPCHIMFSTFIQTHHPFRNGLPLLTDNHWYVAEKILQFVELFYDSTVALSGVYYPTSSLMLHHLLEIASHLHEYENDELLRPVVVPMKDKFLKYWRTPMLYDFAYVLDPRDKMKGLHNILCLLPDHTGADYSRFPTEVRGKLTKVFERYEYVFGDDRLVMIACIDPNSQQVSVLVRRKWLGIKFLLLMLVALLVMVLHWEGGHVLLFHLLQLFQSCPLP